MSRLTGSWKVDELMEGFVKVKLLSWVGIDDLTQREMELVWAEVRANTIEEARSLLDEAGINDPIAFGSKRPGDELPVWATQQIHVWL